MLVDKEILRKDPPRWGRVYRCCCRVSASYHGSRRLENVRHTSERSLTARVLFTP